MNKFNKALQEHIRYINSAECAEKTRFNQMKQYVQLPTDRLIYLLENVEWHTIPNGKNIREELISLINYRKECSVPFCNPTYVEEFHPEYYQRTAVN